PLDGGLEEEEEECISDANELTAKDEFSVEENFPADFEPDNLTCEDMEYFCGKGEENGNRETGETEMETDSEKTRHPPLEPEEWDGPRTYIYKKVDFGKLAPIRSILHAPFAPHRDITVKLRQECGFLAK
ncbi:hypothetical protein cypCar_00018758, partial [Cyprinus carpio]